MIDLLVIAHSILRWPVLAVLFLTGAFALFRSAQPREFLRWPFSVAVGLLDLQVLLGLVLYIADAGWAQTTFVAMVHPAVMLVVVASAHIALVRARREGGGRAYQIVGATFTALVGITALGIPWTR